MAPSEHPTVPTAPGGLDNYVMTDQPTDCPRCQRRTPYTDLPDGREHHRCAHCGYEFLMSTDFDGEEQCGHCREFAGVAELEAGHGLCPKCVRVGVVWSEEAGDYVTPDDRGDED